MRSVLLLLLCLLLHAPVVLAQDDACAACGGTGLVACDAHDARELALEENALFCSELFACARCGGTGVVDCPRCETEAPLGERRARLDELARGLSVIAEKMGRPVRVAESAHFVVVCELKSTQVERSKLSPHELLHLYLDRLESLYHGYVSLLDVRDDRFSSKPRVFLWSSPEDHSRAGEAFCGWSDAGPVYQRGIACAFSACAGKRPLADDEVLYRCVLHHAAHGIMNLQRPAAFTANLKAGWADVGVAHWFEDRRFGSVETFCYPEVRQDSRSRPGRWRQGARKLLEKSAAPVLRELVQLDTRELDFEQHVLAFSLFDYLMARDPHALNELLTRLRARAPTRDAVKAVYGQDLDALEAAWRAWVLETYPAR